jgi:CheY-like chemotaxis protein
MAVLSRIIYVEDNPADAELFQRNLLRCGIPAEVVLLDNSQCIPYLEKIAQEENSLPDLLIFDLKMPGQNGISILQAVKEIPEFDTTPVVIFSGSMGPQEKAECLRNGASLCLEKPHYAEGWDQTISSLSSFLALR